LSLHRVITSWHEGPAATATVVSTAAASAVPTGADAAAAADRHSQANRRVRPSLTTGLGGGGGGAPPREEAFCSLDVISAAQERKMDELADLATKAIEFVQKLTPPSKGWREEMPIWDNNKKKRCMKKWVKDESFCFTWIQAAVDFYAGTIGVPPVVTGVKKKHKKRKRGRGHTRGQTLLSKADGDKRIDYRSTFLLIIASYYCLYSKPLVEDGTDAAHAVLAVLMEPKTLKVVLSTVCIIV